MMDDIICEYNTEKKKLDGCVNVEKENKKRNM